MKKNKFAFTLAEVLITLGIIGVVAAMTIPTLMMENEKQVEITQLKKFFSVFQQGMKNYMVNQGCNDLECTGIFNGLRTDASWNTNMDAAMRSVFKVTKSCTQGVSGCGEYIRNLDKTPYVNSTFDPFTFAASFITDDGFLFMMYDADAGNCTANAAAVGASKLKNNCTAVYVDVNGLKKPGIWGRDLFIFYLARDGSLYPHGGIEIGKINSVDYTTDASYWKNTTTCGTPGSSVIPAGASGVYCAARIIENGWDMDY